MHSENWCRETTRDGYYGVRVFDRVWELKDMLVHTLTLNRYEYNLDFMCRYTRREVEYIL